MNPWYSSFAIVMIDSSYAIILFVFILKFSNSVRTNSETINVENRYPEEMKNVGQWTELKPPFYAPCSPRVASRYRFIDYDINLFDKNVTHKKHFKRDSVFYGSLYEAIRHFVSDELFVNIEGFAQEYEAGSFGNFDIFELWLILDKLLVSFRCLGALDEYIDLVIKCTPADADFDSDHRLYMVRETALTTAIKYGNTPQTIAKLASHLNPVLRFYEYDEIIRYAILQGDGPYSIKFHRFVALVEAFDPLDCIKFIFRSINFLPGWVHLIPFYFLFKHVDNYDVHQPLRDFFRQYSLGEIDKKIALSLSEILRLTNFCSVYSWKSELSYRVRQGLFTFVMKRFKIEPRQYERVFLKSVAPSNSVALAEAFFLYLFSNDDEAIKRIAVQAMSFAMQNSFLEMAIVIATHSRMSSKELFSNANIDMNDDIGESESIKALLEIVESVEELKGHEVNSNLFEYPMPEPAAYEILLPKFKNTPIDAYWVARLILFRDFGVSFSTTRIALDGDPVSGSEPIWKEIADTVNFFLDLACRDCEIKHRVVVPDEKPINRYKSSLQKIFEKIA